MEQSLEVSQLISQFKESNAVTSLLSGSGSSVFGLFLNRQEAEKTVEKVKNQCRFTVLTQFSHD